MHILSLTPDLFFSIRVQSTLERAGHSVRVLEHSDEEAISQALSEETPDLIILDVGAGWWPWEEALQHVRAKDEQVPILAFGSHINVSATAQAMALGANRVVAKSEFVTRMVALAERYGTDGE